MTINIDKSSNKLLILLLSADLVFILISILYSISIHTSMNLITDRLFWIESDLGYAEIYQYIKEYWIILLLFIVAIKRNHIIYFAWSTLFMYLVLDDALQLHERLGHKLVLKFGLEGGFNLRAQDFGELGITAFFGLLLFSFIGWAYLHSDSVAKQISKHLFILVLSLAFFGVIVDMLHVAIPRGKSICGLIEDGGEMIIMSIIVWYVFDLKFTPKIPVNIHENMIK